MIALIDADILLYECGFSSDANAKKAGVEYEPLEFCLKIVKNKINEIVTITEADGYELYLTGKDNFRLKVLPDYKANRDPNAKPFWYHEIRNYLINVHGAITVDGIEADDILGILQCANDEPTCICTKDKDLDMVPGWHYNWSMNRAEEPVYYVEPLEGLRCFYKQILTGDSTDNIPGLKRSIGKVATKKIKSVIDELTEPVDMWEYILQCYDGFDPLPIAQCIWIMQSEGDIFQPPQRIVIE